MTRLVLAAALFALGCTKSGAAAPDGSVTPTAEVPPAGSGPASTPAGELPSGINASRSSVAGCLASPGRTEQGDRSRAMQPESAKPELSVTPVTGGVRVAHELSHACCLESKIETKVEGHTITVSESLYGTPCRCMCSSTISTSVRLEPGEYTLRVVVDHQGQQKTSEQKLVVK